MPSLTIENYVKTIFQVCTTKENRPAATGELASALSVSPGTVTSMLKTLAESGLVVYTPYEGVRLTDSGNVLALRVLRRHRLIEQFLVDTLGYSWDEVHEEAENMEHAVSDALVDRIDEYLGHPATDPHGDPIPRADGTMARQRYQSLWQWPAGAPFKLVRVMDQSPEFLRYLSDAGLPLEAIGEIVSRSAAAGTARVRVGDREVTLGQEAAGKLLVVADAPTAIP